MSGIKALYASSRPPKEVHQAFQALLAVGALGVVQSIVSLIFFSAIFSGRLAGYSVGGSVVSLVVFLVVLAVLVWITLQMRAGRNWARITLTVLGGLAALGFLISLIVSLSGFGGLAASVLGGGYSAYLIISLLIDALRVALIGVAIYWMYRPNVNSYFT